jgi:hypothetical protein
MKAKVLTAIGGGALTPSGTASANPQPDAFYVQWVSGNTAGSATSGAAASSSAKVAGEVGPFDQTESRYHPVYTALIRTGSDITNQRIWVALTNDPLSHTDAVGSSGARYIGVRFSTAAGDTDWQLASGDGTTGSATDTGVPVQANTFYLIQLNWSIDGQLDCQINNISCTPKTTNLDTGNPTMLGVECTTTALSGAQVQQSTAYISLRYDGNNF